jgi:type IV pilus assembly protein PilA
MRVETRRGFTLLELMLVVGIIGVIAAIAIPNFVMYQARSRRSEAYTNLSAMGRAQKAYQAENNAYHDSVLIAGDIVPDPSMYNGGALGATTMPWDADAQTAFSEVGWAPEGKVYYAYASYTSATATTGPNCGTCDLCFTGAAYGDVDGNGSIQTVLYMHAEQVGGALSWCNEGLLNTPPAIDPGSGSPIFDAVAVRSNSDF